MADESKNPLAGLGKKPEAQAPPRTLKSQGNANSLVDNPPVQVAGASRSLARSGDDPVVRYSSHPISNYGLGRFKFDKGLLQLDADDAAEFEAMLDQLPVTERRKIVKLDVRAAERFLEQRAANRRSGATQQFDSSVGERAGAVPIGTEDLGHASRSQRDGNEVVDVTTGEPAPAAETVGQVPAHEA